MSISVFQKRQYVKIRGACRRDRDKDRERQKERGVTQSTR